MTDDEALLWFTEHREDFYPVNLEGKPGFMATVESRPWKESDGLFNPPFDTIFVWNENGGNWKVQVLHDCSIMAHTMAVHSKNTIIVEDQKGYLFKHYVPSKLPGGENNA